MYMNIHKDFESFHLLNPVPSLYILFYLDLWSLMLPCAGDNLHLEAPRILFLSSLKHVSRAWVGTVPMSVPSRVGRVVGVKTSQSYLHILITGLERASQNILTCAYKALQHFIINMSCFCPLRIFKSLKDSENQRPPLVLHCLLMALFNNQQYHLGAC